MKMMKWMCVTLLAVLCAVPAAAQYKRPAKTTKKKLTQNVEATVQRTIAAAQLNANPTATSRTVRPASLCPCCSMYWNDASAWTWAETDLQRLRDSRDPNAPALTVEEEQAYLEQRYQHYKDDCPCTCQPAKRPQQVAQNTVPAQPEELDTRELIEAEEELAHLRNTRDPHATFETYPYLLDPAYRRGGQQDMQNTHHNVLSTWARKVGM